MTQEVVDLIKSYVDNWDREESINRACEELAELIVALQHIRRHRPHSLKHLKEEMADVYIVLKHLELKFGDVTEEIVSKAKERLG